MTASTVLPIQGTRTAMHRKLTYEPANLQIPEAIRAFIPEDYLELTDSCSWDDAMCENDPDHAKGTGDECLARTSQSQLVENVDDDASPTLEYACRDSPDHCTLVANGVDASGVLLPGAIANSRKRCYSQNFCITPSIMADYVQTKGDLALYPHPSGDESRCIHVVSGTCNVGVPFFGSYIEDAVIANMRAFYDVSCTFLLCANFSVQSLCWTPHHQSFRVHVVSSSLISVSMFVCLFLSLFGCIFLLF